MFYRSILALSFVNIVGASAQETIVPPVNPEGYYGVGHENYHQLYKDMHNKVLTHCCNDGDCRPTTAKWNQTKGLWEAKINGKWQEIEPHKHVIDAYGLTEFASVCTSAGGDIFCFIPPNQGN